MWGDVKWRDPGQRPAACKRESKLGHSGVDFTTPDHDPQTPDDGRYQQWAGSLPTQIHEVRLQRNKCLCHGGDAGGDLRLHPGDLKWNHGFGGLLPAGDLEICAAVQRREIPSARLGGEDTGGVSAVDGARVVHARRLAGEEEVLHRRPVPLVQVLRLPHQVTGVATERVRVAAPARDQVLDLRGQQKGWVSRGFLAIAGWWRERAGLPDRRRRRTSSSAGASRTGPLRRRTASPCRRRGFRRPWRRGPDARWPCGGWGSSRRRGTLGRRRRGTRRSARRRRWSGELSCSRSRLRCPRWPSASTPATQVRTWSSWLSGPPPERWLWRRRPRRSPRLQQWAGLGYSAGQYVWPCRSRRLSLKSRKMAETIWMKMA